MTLVANQECLCEAIFGFRHAQEQSQVRAFYGDATYEAIKKWEQEERARRQWLARNAYGFIDDVGGQLKP
jgi:hypothetical protein